jgi:hypothetical protein
MFRTLDATVAPRHLGLWISFHLGCESSFIRGAGRVYATSVPKKQMRALPGCSYAVFVCVRQCNEVCLTEAYV